MKKSKKVYVSPEVSGIYVLQSINFQSVSSQKCQDDYEIDQKLKEKKEEEERLKELESAREEAYKKGYSDAEQVFKSEIEKLKNEFASLVSSFREAVMQLAGERDKIWRESESEIIKLIMAISKKMLVYEIDNNGVNVIKHIVKEALSYVDEKKIIAVRLSPEDIRKMDTLEGTDIVGQNIKIMEDKTINPGGCIVETDFGNVESHIETCWEEIQKVLLENENGAAVH